MTKVYNPTPRVVYVIFTTNKKGKKLLYSACGDIDKVKSFCDRNGIDYTKCTTNAIEGVHYLEEIKTYDGRSIKM